MPAATALWLIVPGFGAPHLEEKRRILESNLASLARGPWEAIHVDVHVYDAAPEALEAARAAVGAVADARVFQRPGIVGEFVAASFADPPPTFSHTCILLDDVELQPDVDWRAAADALDALGIDVLSPTLTADSPTCFAYMKAGGSATIDVVSACELFCYLATPAALATWVAHYSADNPWVWGMDLILRKHMGLRVGMLRSMTMRHHFSAAPNPRTHQQMVAYLARYGETQASLALQPAVVATKNLGKG